MRSMPLFCASAESADERGRWARWMRLSGGPGERSHPGRLMITLFHVLCLKAGRQHHCTPSATLVALERLSQRP
eukprot:4730193-Alexandrium_andersonii.AAC.1